MITTWCTCRHIILLCLSYFSVIFYTCRVTCAVDDQFVWFEVLIEVVEMRRSKYLDCIKNVKYLTRAVLGFLHELRPKFINLSDIIFKHSQLSTFNKYHVHSRNLSSLPATTQSMTYSDFRQSASLVCKVPKIMVSNPLDSSADHKKVEKREHWNLCRIKCHKTILLYITP